MTSPDTDTQQARVEAAAELLHDLDGYEHSWDDCVNHDALLTKAAKILAAADRVDPPLSRVIALAESEQALGEESYFAEEIGDVIAFLENARLHYAEGGS